MIVHSADGVFAIRQGPWKWIEGKSARQPPLAARAAECQPQLYNLDDDPAEQKDLSEQHPEVAKRLAKLLDQYRQQTHSRN
jgi:arylsulfatase A-like enzyme